MKNIVLIVALSALCFSARAQDSELLNQYRKMSLEYNQDARAAEKNIALSREMIDVAKSDFKPKVAGGANFNYTGNPMELSLQLPAMQPFAFQGNNTSYGASVNVLQPVYTGGRVRESLNMAKKESNLAVNQAQVIKSDVCYQTDYYYWATVARQEIVGISQQFQKSVGRLVEVVRERVEVELVDKNDLLMAEVKLNEADFQLMQAKNDFEVGRMSLNAMIGVDLKNETKVDPNVPAIKTVGTLATEMKNVNRPELRMAEDQIAIQESMLKLKNSEFMPQLYVGAEGNYTAPGYDFNHDLDPNYAVYAKVSIPIFEWGKRRKVKNASNYRIAISKDNYSKVKDRVSLEVETSYYTYSQAVERVLLTESSLQKAAENERSAFDKYKEGKISILEVLNAQIYHQTAQLNYVQSRMMAQIYRSEFIRALGLYQFN